MARRRRPAQLRRAAVDAARDDGRCARAVAAPDRAATRARRLRAERGNARQALERLARCSGAPRRLPPRAPARRAAVPRGSARARAARRRVLADLLSEALQQPALVAERSV